MVVAGGISMPQGPNPQTQGQPGVRGREAQEPNRDKPAPLTPVEPKAPAGRQPQHPGQPGRWESGLGGRDEGAAAVVTPAKDKGGAA
jgi:hypothetical protein